MARERNTRNYAVRTARSPGVWMATAIVLLLLLASAPTWANVYASGLTKTGDYTFTYILNEDATNVRMEVWLGNGSTMVDSDDLGSRSKGLNEWTWDGTGSQPGFLYKVKVIASDDGHSSWTKISDDANVYNQFEQPRGVSVNKFQNGPNFGKIYVSNTRLGTTVTSRACQNGFYVLNADCSNVGFYTGGRTWPSPTGTPLVFSPRKTCIGPDGHLYVADYQADLAFEFSPDMSTLTQLIVAGNKTANQWVSAIYVDGTGADRKLYLVNGNPNDAARKGVIRYDIGTNTTVPAGVQGTQFMGPAVFGAYYPYDLARDSAGNWYTDQYRSTAGQFAPVMKFTNRAVPPALNAPDVAWSLATSYTYAYGMDVSDRDGLVAWGSALDGIVHIFNISDGSLVLDLDCGGAIREIAFDAAGNMVTVDNSDEVARIWSPPTGPNSFTTESYFTLGLGAAYTLSTTACANGTVGGDAGTRYANQLTTVTATGNTLYQFKNWTTDGCGGTAVVSTSASYTFNMPPNDYALYANFELQPVLTVGKYPDAGGTVTGAGGHDSGSSVTVTATANANYKFLYWSTAADGYSGVVSGKPSYTFNMPANDYTLYAIFAKAIFEDGFEGKTDGYIDSNYTGGVNAGVNGNLNDNPWFGPGPPNNSVTAAVSGVTVNSGGKMFYGTITNAQNDVNIAYRCNGGSSNMTSNFYFDWYFYDPAGTGANAALYADYASLCRWGAAALGTVPYTADFVNVAEINRLASKVADERISIGASATSTAVYQYGVGEPISWTNTAAPRSVGWHHARIAVGASNSVSFFIDDMVTSVGTTTASGSGFNALELNCFVGTTANVTGYFDDISILVPGTQSIDKWSVIGHFENAEQGTRLSTDYFAGSGVTETTVVAKTGETYNGKTWGIGNGGVLDLNQYYGATTTDGASYMFTFIKNTGAAITDADLTCGSDDGIKVWLNGTEVINRDVYRSCWQNVDEARPLTINHGINKLMVKISQGAGDYKGQCKITRTDGSPLPNCTFFPSDSAGPTGSITIEGGDGSTDDAHVTLTLDATDDISDVVSMCFANEDLSNPGNPGPWSVWEPYGTSKAWLLPGLNDLTKTVYVKFLDSGDNVSDVYADSIYMHVDGNTVLLQNCKTLAGFVAGYVDGASVYALGTPVTVVAHPNPGYSFDTEKGWTTDGCGGYTTASTLATYSFLMPDQDPYTLSANFTANNYTLTVDSSCGHGTGTITSPDPDENTKTVATDTSCEVTATADENYRFKDWTTVSCAGTFVSTANPYTFLMEPHNYTLYANFEYKPLLTVSNGTAHGTLGGDATGRYDAGSSRTVSTTADGGWRLYGWSTDAAGNDIVHYSTAAGDTSYTFNMPAADYMLYAQYVLPDLIWRDGFEGAGVGAWTVTVGTPSVSTVQKQNGAKSLLVDSLGIRLYGVMGENIPSGTKVAVRLWMRDPSAATKSCQGLWDLTVNPTLVLNTGVNTAGSANYWERCIGSAGNPPPPAAVPWNAMTATTRVYNSWSRHEIFYDGFSTANYYVNGVLGKTYSDIVAKQIKAVGIGIGVGAASDPVYYDDVAVFTNPAFLNDDIRSGDGQITGTLDGNAMGGSAKGYYYSGETVALTAVPATGWLFDKWVDETDATIMNGGDPQGNPYSFTMTSSDKTVRAVFKDDPANLLLTTGKNIVAAGNVTPATGYHAPGSIAMAATLNAGYTFTGWYDNPGGTGTPVNTNLSFDYTLSADSSLYAIYAGTPHTLTVIAKPTAGGTATITAPPPGGASETVGTGAVASLSASPASGYKLLGWSSDANGLIMLDPANPAANPYSYTMPNADATVYAQFVGSSLLFYESFENGRTAWTNANGGTIANAAVSTDRADIGTHSLKIIDAAQRVTHAQTVTGDQAFRFWLWDPDVAENLIYIDARQGLYGTNLMLGFSTNAGAQSPSDNTVYKRRAPSTAYFDMPLATRLIPNWNRVDIGVIGTNCKYYVNGVETASFAVTSNTIDNIYLGYASGGHAMPATYFDDIAMFTSPKLLTVSVKAGGGTGTISGEQFGSALKGSLTGYYYEKEVLKLTATGTGGSVFSKWVDGADVELSTANPYDYTVGGADAVVKAVFTAGDTTAPTGSIVINGGETTNSLSVTLTLTASDVDDAVASYVLSNDNSTWSDPQTFTTSPMTSVPWSLAAGPDGLRTVYVKYTDSNGNPSIAYPDTIALSTCSAPLGTTNVPANAGPPATAANRISGIWALTNGATVYNLTGKIVTAMWSSGLSDNGFWIEEADRSAGIKVLYSSGSACTVGDAIAVGKSVTVYGTFSTGDMRVMTASVVVTSAGTAIEPVIVTEKYSGGKEVNALTPAVSSGKGIYGVGLLVKIAGSLSLDVPSGNYYLDDGSGLLDGTIKGMRVISLTTPLTGNKVVTGVIGIISGKPVIYATTIQ